MVKGGVWKNTEDEILKAAVMKYGKNQWARISSLLVRKSPKLCKARWYEWLDPSIKKTEWSREEEEKLLHLAKLMPTQWRTIAPIVGRTASQCLEHYNKLLDAAQEKDESYDPLDDPRRLRPGEIDPNPEAKPARPDPVDMDEDEKEMLSEARARLANTKGKKAKRKAREKQLEEARRLASLQKRRELKAAGIDVPDRKKRIKGIDYNKEIAFQKKAPAGFFEIPDEELRPPEDPSFVGVNLDQLEGKRRTDEESKRQNSDAKRAKIREQKNMPAAIMQINKLNDPEQVRKRAKLSLPTPQITDEELEQIAKMEENGMVQAEGGTGATSTLLSNYAATPMQTPAFRTPARTPVRVDNVLLEAQNLIALTNAQTPLKGGENTPLHPSDFSGATPRPQNIQTPNALATPLRTPSRTPAGMVLADGSATPRRTALRDQLNLNASNEDSMSDGMSVQAERRRMNENKSSLRKGLLGLPAPKNEYSITVPQTPDLEEQDSTLEDDASDVLERKQKEQREREQARLRERSTVIQRNLPRPLSLPKYKPPYLGNTDFMSQAEELVRAEVEAVLIHDAELFPLTASMAQASFPDWDSFSEEEITAAKEVLAREQLTDDQGQPVTTVDAEHMIAAWEEAFNDVIYVPPLKKFVRGSKSGKPQVVLGLQARFEGILAQMKREAGKAKKIESKISVYNGGYMSRSDNALGQIATLYNQLEQTATEANCFRALRDIEMDAITLRIAKLTNEAEEQIQRENRLQTKYANLMVEREDLIKSLKS